MVKQQEKEHNQEKKNKYKTSKHKKELVLELKK